SFRCTEWRALGRMTTRPREFENTSTPARRQSMTDFKRRDFLRVTAGVAAGSSLGAGSALFAADAAAQQLKLTPEKGAKLRVLRWKRFVQGDEDKWAENTKKYTQ